MMQEQRTSLSGRFPDFFVIGAPKCGTTSLFSWLEQHPDTYLPNKEPNVLSWDVFDARDIPGAYQNWDQYLGALCPADKGARLSGDFTPRSLFSDRALDTIANHPHRPKSIAIVRNPVDLVFSLHGQMIRQGVETELDFEAAWERSLALGTAPEGWRNTRGRIDRRLDYPLYGTLGARIGMYAASLGPESLRTFVLEEDVSTRPAAFFAEVLEFLGLPHADVSLERQNERTDLRSPRVHRALLRSRDAYMRLRGAAGFDVMPARHRRGTGLLKFANRFNSTQPHSPAGITPDLRQKLVQHFAEDVAALKETLGRDLPTWRDWATTARNEDVHHD